MHINPLYPPVPRDHDTQLVWEALSGAASTLAIANLSLAQEKLLLLIAPSTHVAETCYRELQFFLHDEALPIYFFPDWETLPYDHFSPHEDIISERLWLLYRLPQLTQGIVIAALPTLMHRLSPRDFIQMNSFAWSVDDRLNLSVLQNQLVSHGYHHVEQVMQHGEFAVRGSIIDIFPMGSDISYRVELFDQQIETIRSFDPETQRSIEKVNGTQILPAHEYPLDEQAMMQFRQKWREIFSGNPTESPVYQHISRGKPIGGIEYYLPLFFKETATFFDYLPNTAQCILLGNLPEKANQFWQEIQHRYEQFKVDRTRPLCSPNDIFISTEQFFLALKPFLQIKMAQSDITDLPDVVIDYRKKDPLMHLKNFIETKPGRILLCAESMGRREVILELCQKNNLTINITDSWKTFLNDTHDMSMTVAAIENALWLKSDNIVLLTETQLFGQSLAQQTRSFKKRALDPDTMIRSLAELQIGALVVHIDHGIGKYDGLQRITTDEVDAEYLTLTYHGGDRIYVPITALHLISRYIGGNVAQVSLNKLGTDQWEKSKRKAAQKIRDVAAELLKIYAERESSSGFAFEKPTQDFVQFRRAFPFEETPDQRQAIDTVIADMTSAKCMDRLICGDVGFGKTEVAMQAAFLAVQSGKQVAILVPTTLLANQHVENFQNRFSDYPIKIGLLSRLQSDKNQKEIIEKLKSGQIDIVIGTHALLNDRVQFKELGLLIIDEEHRFGVRQKERMKSLRAHVDILTLTATPIPRTLNLSLAGMRDLSIIATPPAKRLSIKTFFCEYDDNLIKEAILREIMRGGQVYFLHNNIDTIAGMAEQLHQLLPDMKVAIGHGQMPEKQLEKTMSDFYHQRFDVLICTTIIESGIDIPTANTMIVNDANRFGLAQLHQIRGRVGRSHHQAYAYLLVQNPKNLSADAEKRLQALTELDALGVGFQLATQDLEIRGAGELLGESQSGHIETIGFHLYMELLDNTIQALKLGKELTTDLKRSMQPEIDLHICALFPDDYIHDVHTRLVLYKRLSECQCDDDIEQLQIEMIDRFGLLPEAAKNLFVLTKLRIQAAKIGIRKLDTKQSFGYIHFTEKPNCDPRTIIRLIQQEHQHYKLIDGVTLRFTLPVETHARFATVEKLLGYLLIRSH